jgi:hypothetical protein
MYFYFIYFIYICIQFLIQQLLLPLSVFDFCSSLSIEKFVDFESLIFLLQLGNLFK